MIYLAWTILILLGLGAAVAVLYKITDGFTGWLGGYATIGIMTALFVALAAFLWAVSYLARYYRL